MKKRYKMEEFDLLTEELNWSTGEFDYSCDSPKIITLNLFAPERRTILPYKIKEQVEVLVNNLVQRYQANTEDVFILAKMSKIYYIEETQNLCKYNIIVIFYWKDIDNFCSHEENTEITTQSNGKLYTVCRNYFRDEMEKVLLA